MSLVRTSQNGNTGFLFFLFLFPSLLAVERCESVSERKYLLALSLLASVQYFLLWRLEFHLGVVEIA